MSDIFKIFRRQRSVKSNLNEETNGSKENVSTSDIEKQKVDASYFRHMSVSAEYAPGEFSVSSTKQNQGFKEPKSWRKSLRKLKLKKPSQSISVSSDNIVKMLPYSVVPKSNEHNDCDTSSTSKRWSYSPDLSEDNVPGARELRGTLERNLSVKKESDEIEYLNKYRQSVNQGNERTRANTYFQYPVADERLDNSTLSSFQPEEMTYIEAHSNLGRSHSTPNANTYVQNPFIDHPWVKKNPEVGTSNQHQDMSYAAMDTDISTSKHSSTIFMSFT